MVQIEMGVACRVDKFTCLQACHLCHHHQQQGVGGYVEGYAEEGVCRTLVELEGESSVCDIELKKTVAGGESHLVDLRRIPCGNEHTAGLRTMPDHFYYVTDLVDGPSFVVGP